MIPRRLHINTVLIRHAIVERDNLQQAASKLKHTVTHTKGEICSCGYKLLTHVRR